MTPDDIDLVTNDELCMALKRRHGAVVVVWEDDGPRGATSWDYGGSLSRAVGLVEFVRTRMRVQVESLECETEEP